MKKRIILLILLVALLLDVQRVSAAEMPKLHTVTGEIIEINDNCVYWDDGKNIYFFYGVGYHTGEKISNVLNTNGVHVFIDLREA